MAKRSWWRRALRDGVPALLLFSGTASAGPPFDTGREDARAWLPGAAERAREPDFEAVPNYQGTDVPEATYAEEGPAGLEERAATTLPDHQAGSELKSASRSRPRFTIDRETDPLVARERRITGEPEAIAGALETEYSECEARTVESAPPRWREARCTEWPVSREETCERRLSVRCERRDACSPEGLRLAGSTGGLATTYQETTGLWEYRVFQPGGRINTTRAAYDTTTRFDVEDPAAVTLFQLHRVTYDDHMAIWVNGALVFNGPNGGPTLEWRTDETCEGDDRGFCRSFSYVWNGLRRYAAENDSDTHGLVLDRDLRHLLRPGRNEIRVRVIAGGRYGLADVSFRMRGYCPAECSERWVESAACGSLAGRAATGLCTALDAESCSEGPAVRVVDGVEVERACWAREQRYACYTGDVEGEPWCDDLRTQGCEQIGSTCTEPLADGSCAGFEQAFRCPAAPAEVRSVMDCGDQAFCLDENCTDTGYEPSPDFAMAASYLSAAEEAAAEFDPDSLTTFTGEDRSCRKAALGFNNCCADSGWGQSLGLAGCSEGEAVLAEQKAAGQCHYVGSYCSRRTLFGCRQRKEGYCCFQGKLARIIQEQGRPQLGLGWGSARHPDCRGLTPEQLTRLDWSAMDLSEFYSDVLARTAPPDQAELGAAIESRILEMLP